MIPIIDSVTSLTQGTGALPAILDANRMVFLNICVREGPAGSVFVFAVAVVAVVTSTLAGRHSGRGDNAGVCAFFLRNLLNIAAETCVQSEDC